MKTERLVCNGLLSVTDTGEVYKQYGDGKGQLMKQYPISSHGKYRCVRPTINGKQETIYVHRLVAEAFLQNPNNLPQVNHKDGNPSNNRIENLEWVTASENFKHALRTGLASPYSRGYTCCVCGKKIANNCSLPYCKECYAEHLKEARNKPKKRDVEKEFLESLTGRDRKIVERWANGETYREIGEQIGVSRQCVQQKIKRLHDRFVNGKSKNQGRGIDC